MHQHEVLDDVGKHLDRMRLFDVIASFWTLRYKHTSKTKTPVKRKFEGFTGVFVLYL